MNRERHPTPAPCAEMDLLCACLSPVRDGERVDGNLAWGGIAWTRLLELATNHHVIPLVHRSLKAAVRRRAGIVPPEYVEYLHRTTLTIAAHNLRASVALERLQQGLAAEGIRLIPVKGPALAVLAHGKTSLRQFEDLDLLVCREDLLRAVAFLEREGYALRELPPGIDRKRYLSTLQDWALHKPGAPPLDLKPVLISHTLSGPETTRYMQGACRGLDLGDGRMLEAPGPEAMLLAVCLDGANEMWMKLSAVADTGHLISAFPDADWGGLLRDAARFGHRRSVLVGAQVAEILLGPFLPAAFREAADAASWRLAEQAAARLVHQAPRHTAIARQMWFAWRTRDRWRDRARLAARLLFVPGPYEWNAMPSPFLLPLHAFVRPLRLAWNVTVRGGRPQRLDGRRASPPRSGERSE